MAVICAGGSRCKRPSSGAIGGCGVSWVVLEVSSVAFSMYSSYFLAPIIIEG